MEAGLYMNQLVKLPLTSNGGNTHESLIKHTPFSTKINTAQKPYQQKQRLLLIRAKGKKGMAGRQYQRKPPPPPLPKLEDDGNPKFVIFIRMANRAKVYLWYPLNIVSGGTTAKVIVAAKDTFVGKYIYKDTLSRNLAAVIYKDEKEMQKMAMKQFRVLRSATEFKYGYKLIENNNLRAALAANDVIELPSQAELKTVFDKVKDFFGDAKESFGKTTFLNSGTRELNQQRKMIKKILKKNRGDPDDLWAKTSFTWISSDIFDLFRLSSNVSALKIYEQVEKLKLTC